MTTALRTHEGRAAGPSRHRGEGPDWEQVSHGLHAPYGTRLIVPAPANALARVLPSDAAVDHLTGAALRCVAVAVAARRAAAVRVHQRASARPTPRHVPAAGAARPHRHGGSALRLVGIGDNLVDLARDLELVDLVPGLDAALRTDEVTPADVLGSLRPRMHGLPRLRRALALADPRSESCWESVLRLVHVRAGITAVESQHWIDDARTVRGDLWLVGTCRIVDYDGAEHRSAAGHRRVQRRDKDICRSAWERYAYVSQDIATKAGRILRDAEAALGLRHEPARLGRWLAYARRSTLTGEGRARLERRLARYVLAAQRPDRQ